MIPVWKWFVTENHLLPHSLPEQSTLWGLQGSSWRARPKCSVSGFSSSFMLCFYCICNLIDFIHLFTHWLLVDEWKQLNWIKSLASTCFFFHLRFCVLPSLMLPHLFWMFVFCMYLNSHLQRGKSQGYKNTKLSHNTGDNHHDNIHSLERESQIERQADRRRCGGDRNLSDGAVFFPRGTWAISAVNICLMRSSCNN